MSEAYERFLKEFKKAGVDVGGMAIVPRHHDETGERGELKLLFRRNDQWMVSPYDKSGKAVFHDSPPEESQFLFSAEEIASVLSTIYPNEVFVKQGPDELLQFTSRYIEIPREAIKL